MRRISLAAMLAVAATTGAHAQSAQQRYQGTFFVTLATAGCATSGATTASVGDHYVFVFRTEEAKQLFAIFDSRRAMSYAPSTAARFAASGRLKGTSIGGGAGVTVFTSNYSKFVISPATFAADTQTMSFSGVIADFDGVLDCDIKFAASGLRRPGF